MLHIRKISLPNGMGAAFYIDDQLDLIEAVRLQRHTYKQYGCLQLYKLTIFRQNDASKIAN
jgi:hypothetical protein